jgi:ParB family chromosome partitioning protein
MEDHKITYIKIDEINIPNPRVRNRLIAEEITQNIKKVGLKRPIKVRSIEETSDGKKYSLVCGQGRLEAFIEADEEYIPAIVTDISAEDAYISSLVENIARRHYSSVELVQKIKYLKDNGYSEQDIAQKTSLDKNYIRGIIKLVEYGEERLVKSVENGITPLYIALKIATENDIAVQNSLIEAQEQGELGPSKLAAVQKMLAERKLYGKGRTKISRNKMTVTQDELFALYEMNVKQKRKIINKANYVNNLLYMSAAALKKLFNDNNFINQLKVEGISEIPKQIKELISTVK